MADRWPCQHTDKGHGLIGDLELGGHARPTKVPSVPEIILLLADEVFSVWQDGDELPFWAFAWPGGQVLARWILDHPDLVAGRDVVDLGCASGLVGIAAARAGARSVLCIDVDPMATAAAQANACLNGVVVEILTADVLDEPADADAAGRIVLAGDLLYERNLAERSTGWLRRQSAAGAWALAGDAERSYAPTDGIRVLAEFGVDTHAGIERGPTASVRVLEILAPG
jgi:predicted nicotinamide N-methyase